MKNLKSLLFIAAFLFVSFAASYARPVHAAGSGTGNDQLDSMIAQLTQAASVLNDKGYTVVNMNIDNGLKGEKYTSTRTLYGGNDYAILGVGGDGIADLDIALLDKDGNVIDKDTETDATPVVQASVKADDQFFIQTIIADLAKDQSSDNSYYYGYVIGFKNTAK